MDVFFSCDIEGVAGVTSWADAGAPAGPAYAAACAQMSRETAAACKGALAAGAERILVKDAHDTGRNIDPAALPEEVQLNRGFAGDIWCMMSGIQHGEWDAAGFLGYHSGASLGGSPLGHTMSLGVDYIELNGQRVSEFVLNAYTASLFGVPVCFVSGDAALCDQARRLVPAIACVPTSKGIGASATTLHPALAAARIQEAVRAQLDSGNYKECLLPLPEHFDVYVRYKEEAPAYRAGFYPGAEQVEEKTVHYVSGNYEDVLRLLQFIL